ncbi:phage tail assembly protein [Campylobacter sp. 7477a]|uniref:phage tail assembly protein n=1 Tax=Campylobacter sp. 7477a TaxID=2735741 RepID=UPI00301548E5|nr:phage tail assembly protein [Campylobacter sp. 7477a]
MANTKTQNQNIVEENSNKYTVVKLTNGNTVKVRHPKGRDLRGFMSGTFKQDDDSLFRLASSLTCLSLDELDDMDGSDFKAIMLVVSGFLA